jgi:hypothetical protein
MKTATLILAFLLAGCALRNARMEYESSAEAYKQCLAAHPSAPQQCDGLRLAMEADERKFNNFIAATQPGGQRAVTATVLNR